MVVVACVALWAGTGTVAQTDQPAAGVPLHVAEWRARAIANVRYELTLRVTALERETIRGDAVVRFELSDTSKPLVVDFSPAAERVRSLAINGRREFHAVNGHLVLPASALRRGENVLRIAFDAGDAPLNRSAEFLYALFVPARAHQAIPCFDQPSLKVRWTLRIEVPAATSWRVIANARHLDRTPIPGTPDFEAHAFAETAPLPPYLFSFVIGEFQTESATRGHRQLTMHHRETDGAKVARNREKIFDLHAQALAYMEEYTGIAYPFDKLEFVMIPAFQFAGMEHAGKILYNAPAMLLDDSATQNQHLARASTIAHETAHMWFGDLVTMRWFDDVWLKEVFANFMAAKIVNPSFPEVNHELRFLLSHYPAAYEVDRTAGTNPIRQPLENLSEAGSLYGAIIYQKAPIVMRHLEQQMGPEAFRDGLREYLRKYSFGNASWADLVALLDPRIEEDLATWSRAWVDERGRPSIATELEVLNDTIRVLRFRQSDPFGRGLLWPQKLRVTLGYAKGDEELSVSVGAANTDVTAARGRPAPLYVLPNGGGWAYAGFRLDARSLEYLSTSVADLRDPLTRGAAWVTLWDAMLERDLPPEALVSLALRALPRDSDEQLTNRILGYLRTAWWRFLPHSRQSVRRGDLERVLMDGLARAQTPSQKGAWFGALRELAGSPAAVDWLQRVWRGDVTIAGLSLAEADFASLALDLAVREVEGWRDLLHTQVARMKNPDRKARLAFVLPAVSADPAERAQWFERLADVENRRREPWVVEGLAYLNHPMRAEVSAKFVRPSLELLEEIHRTGDIFFPTRFLGATLAGHRSPQVARIVHEFLATRAPQYPPRLRNVVLRAADELFRAAEAEGR